MELKEYLISKIKSEANISVMKYCLGKYTGACAYFHSACRFGEMYGNFFQEEEYSSFKYIEIMQETCKHWNVNYAIWFNDMCEYVYVK